MLKHFTWNTVSGPKSLAIISTAMALKWHHSKAESEEELQSLDESKEESEKVGLKLNIKKTKIMASGPITSWQIGGETGNSERLYFWGLQNHCDGDCRYEIKRYLLLGRKPRQHITKQRHYFANKGPFSQSYGFSSNQNGCERLLRKLSAEALMFLNCGVGEDSWESLGLQEDATSPS